MTSEALEGEPVTQKRSYLVTLDNGQRRYVPATSWTVPVPSKGCEVFVGKLPRDMLEDELLPVLERAGTVYEIRLMMDFTGDNRGFAFVQFASREEADKAVQLVNNLEVRPGRFIGVMKSLDNNRLFVGGIPKTRLQEEVLDEMKRLTEGVTSVILYPSVNDRSKNRGYAFVEYDSHRAAALARRKLIADRPILWGCHEVKVDWAEPEPDVDQETMSKVKILYVRNLALDTTEISLRAMFSSLGGVVERVKKQRDYAFVHFATREQADEAKRSFNGILLDGCEIEISWSKPIKNREEYQQRRALSRALVSAQQSPLTSSSSPNGSGDSLVSLPHIRTAAGAQGMQTRVKASPPRISAAQPVEVMLPQFQSDSLRCAKMSTSIEELSALTDINCIDPVIKSSSLQYPIYLSPSPIPVPHLSSPTALALSALPTASTSTYYVHPAAYFSGYETVMNSMFQPACYGGYAISHSYPGLVPVDRF